MSYKGELESLDCVSPLFCLDSAHIDCVENLRGPQNYGIKAASYASHYEISRAPR